MLLHNKAFHPEGQTFICGVGFRYGPIHDSSRFKDDDSAGTD